MNLAHVLLGPVVTEKAERLKATGVRHTYTVRVAPQATKVDVKSALRRFYNVDVAAVRMISVRAKTRSLGAGKEMEKRHAFKKALITLTSKSKPLDLTALELSHS